MKHYLVTFLLLAGAFLSSCQDEPLGQGPEGPVSPVGPGSNDMAGLTLKIGSVRTRADQVNILPGELTVKSIACFVRTKDFGKPGDTGYKQGVFLPYFIDDENDIEDNGDGSFEVNLEVQSPSVAGKSDVAVIANYKENGLEAALKTVTRWDDLLQLTTPAATAAGIKRPLLMFGYKEVTLSHTAKTTESISMERLVARFDIENKAFDAPKKPFLLQSVEVINPKTQAYLVPGNEDTYNIPVLETGFTKVDCIEHKRVEGIYTYEAANDGSVAHTALLIRGTLDGVAYAKRIDLMKDGEIIALARNTRYLITLNPAADQSGIDWSFTVDDWSEGTVIPVKPEYQKPVASNMTFEDAAGQPVAANTWDNTMKACLLGSVNAGDKIKFTVDNLQNTNAVISFINGDWADLGITDQAGKDAFITSNASIESKATVVKEEYTITFPAAPTTAFEMEIRLESKTKPGYYESFRLIFLPEFDCMIEAPKLLSAAGGDVTNGNWHLPSKTFFVDRPEGNFKITFKVKTFHSSKAELTVTSGNLSYLGITASDIKVKKTTKEGNYVIEEYEIVFPEMVNFSVEAEVKIANAIKPEKFDKFILKRVVEYYPSPSILGVRIGNLLWAPVNVGATSVDNSNPSLASTGKYYQWGRTNNGFDIHGTFTTTQGPTAWSNRENGTFYYTGGSATQNDWLTNSGTDHATRDAYWSTPANTPCPTGWRLPTKAEADQFQTARQRKAVREDAQKRWKVTGDDGQALYFPQTGRIMSSDGSVSDLIKYPNCYLWTSEKYPDTSSRGHFFSLNGANNVTVSTYYVSYGFALRCVKSL